MVRLIVHSFEHARAALIAAQETGRPVILESPPDGVRSLGAPLFLAVIAAAAAEAPQAQFEAVLDCGTEPGSALGALRAGARSIRLSASNAAFAKVADIAKKMGARTEAEPADCAVYDLAETADPLTAARAFVASHRSRH